MKAQSGFGRTDDGGTSGTTYLLGGVVEETYASVLVAPDSRCKPRLSTLRPAAVASSVLNLWASPSFLKASLKNHLLPAGAYLSPLGCHQLLVEFLAVPVCAHVSSRNGLSCSP